MNKKIYLNALHKYLFEKEVIKKDINAVINDYSELYDEALALGFSDADVAGKLGKPNDIYHAIKDTLHFDSYANSNKIVAVMPFIATILFFAVGFGLEGWQYAWSFYLLIPVTAILVNVRGKEKIIALTPFVSTIVFFMLGIFFNLWHPGWLIYLIIPVTAILLNVEAKEKFVALLPFLLVTIYVVIISYVSNEFYLYGWVIFMLIPVLALLLQPLKLKHIMMVFIILIAVGAHLSIYFMTKDTTIAWLPYLFPLLMAIHLGYIQIITDGKVNFKENKWTILSILLVVGTYFLVSFLVGNIWTWSWLILLLIPMIAIFNSIKFQHPVAYMPFIAVIIFMLLGMLGGYWNVAWMVFLLIPITAILTESGEKISSLDKTDDFDQSSD